MSKFWTLGLIGTVVVGFWSAEAMAQHSAGWKMRGGGDSFWSSGSGRSSYYYGGPSYYYGPSYDAAQSYRSFSYEPAAIQAGNIVRISGDDVKMMRGTNVVGAVPNGLTFKVRKVVNGWLGAVVEVDGEKLNGWVWHGNVTLEVDAPSASAVPPASSEGAQVQTYRRYSYEPSFAPRSYRSYERTKEPWRYPKTDPRRYRP